MSIKSSNTTEPDGKGGGDENEKDRYITELWMRNDAFLEIDKDETMPIDGTPVGNFFNPQNFRTKNILNAKISGRKKF